MKIFGNSRSQDLVKQLLSPDSAARTICLVGPSRTGKRSFLETELRQVLDDSDIYIADVNVEGSRGATAFSLSAPVFSSYRAIVVDNAENLSDAAKDAYLKLCEEPPISCRVFFITTDDGLLPEPLQTRIRHIIRFCPLSQTEMVEFFNSLDHLVDPDVGALCYGRPGYYSIVLSNTNIKDLKSAVSKHARGDLDVLMAPVPEFLKSIKSGVSDERSIASLVIHQTAREFVSDAANVPRVRSLIYYSSNLVKYPAVNVDLHWQRSLFSSSL